MKRPNFVMTLLIAITMFTSVASMAADHPAYLHALSDLRGARWLIDHRPGNSWKQSADESAAVRAIDAAMNDIKHAAIDDHKDINDHVGIQEINERIGRLRQASQLLRRTREDVNKRETNDFSQGLKVRALRDIDEAIKFTDKAIATK
jgi:hypothetical protein